MIDVYEKIIKKALENGLNEVEVYSIKSTVKQFKVSNDKVIEAVYREDEDIGIRGAYGKRTGSVRVNTLQLDVDSITKKLLSAVKSSPEDPYWPGFPPTIEPVEEAPSYDDRSVNMSEEEYMDTLRHLMEKFKEPALARGADKASVVEGSFTISKAELTLLNSNGVMRRGLRSIIQVWLGLYVEKTGSQADKFFIYERSKLDERVLEKKVVEEGEKALLFLNSVPVESGIYEVVFDPITTGEILESSLTPAFSALNVLENRSLLKGKQGQIVFSEKVSILDNPFVESATGTRSFDDEGIPTRVKHVVSKGTLEAYLHSYYTAKRMSQQPMGNGIRQNPASQPIPAFTNVVLEPVNGCVDEYIRDMKKGLIVFEVIGQWMSDPVTGGVKATVTHGLLIENGEVLKPVKGLVVSGNIYDWLSVNLVEIGEDVEIIGNNVVPSLWVKNVRVAGK
ncbi:MAG: TldD/PmbA family protein [Desulfurococcaceae archaeon]